MTGGEVAVRMEVDDQTPVGVEDLDQQPRVGTVPGDMLGPEEGAGRRVARAPQLLAVGEPGQPGTRLREDLGGGTHPVLGNVLRRLRDATEPRDPRAAAVEARRLIR